MKKLKNLMLTLLLVTCFVMALPMVGSAATKYYVTKTAVNLRSGAGTKYSRVILLPKAAVVKVTSTSNSKWYKVQYQNNNQQKFNGYIYKSYLQSASKYVTTAAVNLRSGTGTGTSKVTTIPKKATVIITDTYTGEWYKAVYFTSGGKVYRGYVHQNYLKPSGAKTGSYKTTDNVFMHKNPSISSVSVIVVPKGKTVTVKNISHGKWYYCTYKASNGKTYKGYISNVCLKKK